MKSTLFILLLSLRCFALPAKLSDTGLYRDVISKDVLPQNKSYVPQYPLWSDGAQKKRWVYLPPNHQINTEDPDHWVFPVGTKFWKEFSFKLNGQIKRIETRVMEKISEDEWQFGTYLWDKDEKEASLAPEDGVKDYIPTSSKTFHDIPSVTDCLKCHRKMGDGVLGFDAIQLSTDRDPYSLHPETVSEGDVSLKTLITQKQITQVHGLFKDGAPRINASSAVSRTTFGYLHSNCASCHNPVGSSMQMNLNFQYRLSATEDSEIPAFASTVGKRCQVFSFPGVQKTIRVFPADLEKSALVFLMKNPGEPHMPAAGSNIIDVEALKLIRDWVLSLK